MLVTLNLDLNSFDNAELVRALSTALGQTVDMNAQAVIITLLNAAQLAAAYSVHTSSAELLAEIYQFQTWR